MKHNLLIYVFLGLAITLFAVSLVAGDYPAPSTGTVDNMLVPPPDLTVYPTLVNSNVDGTSVDGRIIDPRVVWKINGTGYWFAFLTGTSAYYTSIDEGLTWVSHALTGFSGGSSTIATWITNDTVHTTTYSALVGYGVYYRKGTINGTDITWSATESVYNSTVFDDLLFSQIITDSEDNPYISFSEQRTSTAKVYSRVGGTWFSSLNISVYSWPCFAPLLNGTVYFTTGVGGIGHGYFFDGTTWNDEGLVASSSYSSAMTSNGNTTYYAVAALNLAFIYERTGVGNWTNATVPIHYDGGRLAITVDPDTNDLALFYWKQLTKDLYFTRRMFNIWDSVDNWWHVIGAACYPIGRQITCSPYAVNGKVGVIWVTGASSPQPAYFDYFLFPETADLFDPYDVPLNTQLLSNNKYQFAGTSWLAQTFTPATTHDITRVEINCTVAGGVTGGYVEMGIRATDVNGKPTGTDLVNVTVAASAIGADTGIWFSFNFTSNPTLTADTMYAIVVRTSPSGTFFYGLKWWYSGANPYADGTYASSNNNGSTWTLNTARDLTFKEYGNVQQAASSNYRVVNGHSESLTSFAIVRQWYPHFYYRDVVANSSGWAEFTDIYTVYNYQYTTYQGLPVNGTELVTTESVLIMDIDCNVWSLIINVTSSTGGALGGMDLNLSRADGFNMTIYGYPVAAETNVSGLYTFENLANSTYSVLVWDTEYNRGAEATINGADYLIELQWPTTHYFVSGWMPFVGKIVLIVACFGVIAYCFASTHTMKRGMLTFLVTMIVTLIFFIGWYMLTGLEAYV